MIERLLNYGKELAETYSTATDRGLNFKVTVRKLLFGGLVALLLLASASNAGLRLEIAQRDAQIAEESWASGPDGRNLGHANGAIGLLAHYRFVEHYRVVLDKGLALKNPDDNRTVVWVFDNWRLQEVDAPWGKALVVWNEGMGTNKEYWEYFVLEGGDNKGYVYYRRTPDKGYIIY